MASSLPYSSPNEERAPRRRGGRGFYKDRGLEYHDDRTEQRDRKRRPADREAAALGRHLSRLAQEFPRFKVSLNQMRHHVLVQLRTPEWKAREVLSCLTTEPMSSEEVVEETWLDQLSVKETLAALEKEKHAEKCNRNGDPVVIRRDGKPAEEVYWRRRDNRKSI